MRAGSVSCSNFSAGHEHDQAHLLPASTARADARGFPGLLAAPARPLVRSVKDALRIRRYVQTHTLSTPLNERIAASRGAPEGYDGIAELYWDSLDDLAALATSEAARQAGKLLLEDERKFIDLSRSP